MAILYVTEYATISQAQVGGSMGQVPHEPPLAEQTVAITGASVPSLAFNPTTTLVRIETDSICGITFGTNPTATVATGSPNGTGSQRLVAGNIQFHSVTKGQGYKVAVIATT